MNLARRTVLTGVVSATAGCLFGPSQEPELRVSNLHDESHYLHVRLTGTENEEPFHEVTAYLEPEERQIPIDPIDFDSLEGDFVVITKIDHREEERHDTATGFSRLTVSVGTDGEISFSRSRR